GRGGGVLRRGDAGGVGAAVWLQSGFPSDEAQVASVGGPARPAHQARSPRAVPVCQKPVRAARDEGVVRPQAWDAPQACGLTAFESYASMTCSPPPVAVTHEQHAPTQSGG